MLTFDWFTMYAKSYEVCMSYKFAKAGRIGDRQWVTQAKETLCLFYEATTPSRATVRNWTCRIIWDITQ